MKDTKWLVLINAITIICFTILAIVFKKWWIIFFYALFYEFKEVIKK